MQKFETKKSILCLDMVVGKVIGCSNTLCIYLVNDDGSSSSSSSNNNNNIWDTYQMD